MSEDVTDDDLERVYDRIHLEELAKGGRMGEIRLRVVRRFNAETAMTDQDAYQRGIKEGLERAAVIAEKERRND